MRNFLVCSLLLTLALACAQTPAATPTPPEPTTTPTPTPVPATPTPEPPTPTPQPTGDGVHWTKHPANPVLDVGPQGAWDDTLVGEPRVLRTETGFHMLFVGFDGTKEGSGYSHFYGYGLGAATSEDGIVWQRQSDGPALKLAGKEFGMLWHGGVIEQGQYVTYYTLGNTLAGRTGSRIYRAASPDGKTWTPDDKPALDLGKPGSYDDYDVLGPSLLVENGVYKMWYTAGGGPGTGMTIAYATSPDGITWTKYEKNPVMAEKGAYYPAVLKVGETYMMWYSLPDKNDKGHTAIYLATSPDGITWTQHPDNPVLRHGEEAAWDGKTVFEPSVYFDGRVYHMWFTGVNGPFQEKIGYATSP